MRHNLTTLSRMYHCILPVISVGNLGVFQHTESDMLYDEVTVMIYSTLSRSATILNTEQADIHTLSLCNTGLLFQNVDGLNWLSIDSLLSSSQVPRDESNLIAYLCC